MNCMQQSAHDPVSPLEGEVESHFSNGNELGGNSRDESRQHTRQPEMSRNPIGLETHVIQQRRYQGDPNVASFPNPNLSHQIGGECSTGAGIQQATSSRQLVTTADDRSILNELVSRVNHCASDHYLDVFSFVISIMPIVNLNLVPDFLLMKYLIPKVKGNLAKIFLRVIATQGSFGHVYALIKQELFCDRVLFQLVESHFFRNFQAVSQDTGSYFEMMRNIYLFLRKPIPEEQAVEIILENSRPEVILGMRGRHWPSNFKDLMLLVHSLNRQAVVNEQRLSSLNGTSMHSSIGNFSVQEDPYLTSNADIANTGYTGQEARSQDRGGNRNLFNDGGSPVNKVFRCYYCKALGHTRNNCPQLLSKSVRQGRGPSSRNREHDVCFKCGNKGHHRVDCTSGNE